MNKIVGLKELRENIETYINAVQKKSDSFVIVKRSKPVFKITPLSEEDGQWEKVLDFTKYKKGGIELKKLLSRL